MRIPAQATVDLIRHADIGLSKFKVTVTGAKPYDYVRIYVIDAKTDASAAFEGIDRFVEDMQKSHPADDPDMPS